MYILLSGDPQPSWTPTVYYLGELPQLAGEIAVYPLITNLTELLFYSFITIHDLDTEFERGYYAIYTQRKTDGAQFIFYMNLARVADTIANSQNFWLPFGADFEPYVYAQFNAATGVKLQSTRKVMSCAGLSGEDVLQALINLQANEVFVGQLFITGYKD